MYLRYPEKIVRLFSREIVAKLGEGISTVEQTGENKIIGVTLAVLSGFLIGTSFIFKKKGLLDSNALGSKAGKGHGYLKSKMWWLGMFLMMFGEIANFMAYAFTPAILVTPLGALSVVVSAILSSFFLNEKLDFPAKVGCIQCVLGAIVIVTHAPEGNSTTTLSNFFTYVVSPIFITYAAVSLISIIVLIYFVAPKYGATYPIVYITICSLVGSFLVLSIQGFGSSIIYSIAHWEDDNQFLLWQMYLLIAFILLAIVMQINYLNKALNLFSTAIITPVYYVFFTGCTILSSVVLFHGFNKIDTVSIINIFIGFLTIVGGVSLLFQYSLKVTKYAAMSILPGANVSFANSLPTIRGSATPDALPIAATSYSPKVPEKTPAPIEMDIEIETMESPSHMKVPSSEPKTKIQTKNQITAIPTGIISSSPLSPLDNMSPVI